MGERRPGDSASTGLAGGPEPVLTIAASDRLRFKRKAVEVRAAPGLWTLLTAVIMVALSCGGGSDDPPCIAKQALRDAVRAVNQAESAEGSGDEEGVRQQIGEAERLIGIARRNLSRDTTNSVERGMLEAAEYLDFIVGGYRESGAVDGTLAQFASRELSRAPAPGEAAPNC